MRSNWPLKTTLVVLVTVVAVMLITGYSMLSAHYFRLGMSTMISDNLLHAGRSDDGVISNAGRTTITKRWENQPQAVREAFPMPPQKPEKLYRHPISEGSIVFVMAVPADASLRYVSSLVKVKNVPQLVIDSANRSLGWLVNIGVAAALLCMMLFVWLLRQASRPVNALGRWARDLNEENLDVPPPDFSYRELNEFAQLIQTSLKKAQTGLDRERRLLQHTSHELRTPISIIRNNTELAKKYQKKFGDRWLEEASAIINRIDRTSLTMQQLTETLLWLHRDGGEPLPCQSVALEQLVEQVAEETGYLLDSKPVELTIGTSVWHMRLPEAAARIVLSNLIRNAFQHTLSGDVIIEQKKNAVSIRNRDDDEPSANEPLGFGLGLQLTEQLVERLGWQYRRCHRDGCHCVELTLHPPD